MGITALYGERGERGQMAVEMAVVMPTFLVVLIIVIDLMMFLVGCARFDRAAGEVIRIHACSPVQTEYGATAGIGGMAEDLQGIMDGHGKFTVDVSYGGGAWTGEQSPGAIVSFVPQPQRYICTLEYQPWPLSEGIFGFYPEPIRHTRVYVVDPYRSGALL